MIVRVRFRGHATKGIAQRKCIKEEFNVVSSDEGLLLKTLDLSISAVQYTNLVNSFDSYRP